MSGLHELLAPVNSRTDDFLRGRLGVDPTAAGFKEDGRFNLGGLVALLAVGTESAGGPGAPPEAFSLDSLDDRLVQAALDRVNAPVTPEEAREILELIRSGAVVSDVASALEVSMRFARRLPPDLVLDLLRLPDLPGDLVEALAQDVAGAEPRGLLRRLRDGGVDRAVFRRTHGVLLNRAATRDVAETLRALIGPENRTVRLALLLYARAQGIDVDEADLDALYQAIDPANPDLSPLLARGLDRLTARSRDAGDALAVLRRLAA
jgi:hypothetical protein